MFVAVGLSGILPMSHAVRLFGVDQANLQMGWSWFVWEAVFYNSGAFIYAVSFNSDFSRECMTLSINTDKDTRAMETRTLRSVG